METPPPNYAEPYPLAAKRIGPAWRELWARLDDRKYLCGRCVSKELASSFDLKEITVSKLLWSAGEAGLLARERRKSECASRHMRTVLHYRVISEIPNGKAVW